MPWGRSLARSAGPWRWCSFQVVELCRSWLMSTVEKVRKSRLNCFSHVEKLCVRSVLGVVHIEFGDSVAESWMTFIQDKLMVFGVLIRFEEEAEALKFSSLGALAKYMQDISSFKRLVQIADHRWHVVIIGEMDFIEPIIDLYMPLLRTILDT